MRDYSPHEDTGWFKRMMVVAAWILLALTTLAGVALVFELVQAVLSQPEITA